MNSITNNVNLIGNLGQTPEVRSIKNDGQLTSFSIATNESYTDKNGNVNKRTYWHRCVLFGKRGETLAKYARKGSKLAIQGRLTYNEYTDKEGVKRQSTDIIVNEFSFLDSKPQS